MKQRFYNITSFALALLVLFSTFSFKVEKHFCGEFLIDVAFIGDANDCGMHAEKASPKKKNCCKDEVHYIEGQDELQQKSVDEFDFFQQQFIVSSHVSYNNVLSGNKSSKIYFKDSPPPDTPIDYQVLYQSFLI